MYFLPLLSVVFTNKYNKHKLTFYSGSWLIASVEWEKNERR